MAFSPTAAAISGAVLLVIGIITFPIYNYVIHVELQKIIPLKNKTTVLSSWEHPMKTSDAWIKFYVFDLANPDEVLKGETPVVTQKGPYVYNALKVKQDVTFQPNGTVFYRAPRTMIFNKTLSSGSENDTFTTINVPLYTIMNMLKNNPIEGLAFSLIIKAIRNTTIFRRLTVHDILWGYEDTLLKDLAVILDKLKIHLPIKVDGRFGFFYKKNNTDTGLFNVYTGQRNLSDYMFINSWNRQSHVPYWKTERCNMINGTDGEVYHPFVDINERMYIFVADLCRSIYLKFTETVELEGVPLYRFRPPSKLWQYEGHPENQCYCVGNTCPRSGALNISSCQNGAPVFVSLPHFLYGPHYEGLVMGLDPDNSKHDTYIDVEKTTGVVMEGAKRIQLNVAIEPIHEIFETKHMPRLLFPVLWLDQAAKINDNGMHQFKHSFYYVQNGIHIAAYCLVGLGTLLFVSGIVILVIRKRKTMRAKRLSLSADGREVDERTPLVNSDTGSTTSTESDRTRA